MSKTANCVRIVKSGASGQWILNRVTNNQTEELGNDTQLLAEMCEYLWEFFHKYVVCTNVLHADRKFSRFVVYIMKYCNKYYALNILRALLFAALYLRVSRVNL